jgi:hypothetical protein
MRITIIATGFNNSGFTSTVAPAHKAAAEVAPAKKVETETVVATKVETYSQPAMEQVEEVAEEIAVPEEIEIPAPQKAFTPNTATNSYREYDEIFTAIKRKK